MKVNLRRNVDGTWNLSKKVLSTNIPNVAPYIIQLEEIPDGYPNNIITAAPSANGFTIVNVYPPEENEIYIDYISGTIVFDNSDAGEAVVFEYWGMGSPIRAEDINTLSSQVSAISNNLNNYIPLSGTSNLNGNIIPSVTSSLSLGSSGNTFASVYADEVYVSGSSIYVNGKKVIEDVSDTITVSTDIDQTLEIKTSGSGLLKFTSNDEINSNPKGGWELNVASDYASKHVNFNNYSAGGNITFVSQGANSQIQLNAADEIDLTATTIDVNGCDIVLDGLHKITGLANPSNDADSATKQYVDNHTYDPDQINTDTDNRFVSDAEKSTWNGTINGTITRVDNIITRIDFADGRYSIFNRDISGQVESITTQDVTKTFTRDESGKITGWMVV